MKHKKTLTKHHKLKRIVVFVLIFTLFVQTMSFPNKWLNKKPLVTYAENLVPPELEKAVITPDDFEFIGAFTLPDSNYLDFYRALTHRYVDGVLKLYSLAGPYGNRPPGGYLIEVEVPDNLSIVKPYPIQREYENFGDIFGDKLTLLTGAYSAENPGIGLGDAGIPSGIFWDEEDQRMYWTKVSFYDNQYKPDTGIGYAILDDEAKTGEAVGNWIVPVNVNPNGGRRWTYSMTAIPDWFASAYLGGRRLGIGFGGCESIVSNAVSLGPAFYAINPPNPEIEAHMSLLSTPSISMISHIFGYDRAARVNPSMANFNSVNVDVLEWNVYGGSSKYGVWIDSTSKHGLIVFADMPSGNADTKIISAIGRNIIEVADLGDIRVGDLIFINTNWLDNGRKGYQVEAASVSSIENNTITLTKDLNGDPIITGYSAEVTYSDGTEMTIEYTNRVICGTVYYGGNVRSSRFFNAWYIYDPADLATVAKGEMPHDEIDPVYNDRFDLPNLIYPLDGSLDQVRVQGVTFDGTTNRLYILTFGPQSRNTIYVYELIDEIIPPEDENDDENNDNNDEDDNDEEIDDDNGDDNGENTDDGDNGDGNGDGGSGNGDGGNSGNGSGSGSGSGSGGGGGGGSIGGGTQTTTPQTDQSTTDKITDSDTPLSETPQNLVNPFHDVFESNWFYTDVINMYTYGLMIGTHLEPMLFSPNSSITRAMIVTILHRMSGKADASSLSNPFTDVPDDAWYADAVKWGAANGIIEGYGNKTFGPNDPITREQLATILCRYAEYSNMELPESRNYTDFNDGDSISDYAKEAVRQLYMAEIIEGKPGGLFDPKGNTSRAEAAAMLHRVITVCT
ncbi:MAG: S-layer homology domain-containing protein [Oscillospiraceae bacterium]|nr:S-layer homology domain-containing protein [Oscillospiraceae bacterium]